MGKTDNGIITVQPFSHLAPQTNRAMSSRLWLAVLAVPDPLQESPLITPPTAAATTAEYAAFLVLKKAVLSCINLVSFARENRPGGSSPFVQVVGVIGGRFWKRSLKELLKPCSFRPLKCTTIYGEKVIVLISFNQWLDNIFLLFFHVCSIKKINNNWP